MTFQDVTIKATLVEGKDLYIHEPYMSVHVAANRFGYAKQHIRNLISSGDINSVKLDGHTLLVDKESLQTYCDNLGSRGRPKYSDRG